MPDRYPGLYQSYFLVEQEYLGTGFWHLWLQAARAGFTPPWRPRVSPALGTPTPLSLLEPLTADPGKPRTLHSLLPAEDFRSRWSNSWKCLFLSFGPRGS